MRCETPNQPPARVGVILEAVVRGWCSSRRTLLLNTQNVRFQAGEILSDELSARPPINHCATQDRREGVNSIAEENHERARVRCRIR
jgi:hypothetical protein